MRAQQLTTPGRPLVAVDLPDPSIGPHDILVAVEACGVCRTDLHVVDGELPDPNLPIIPGHEIVGRVLSTGPAVDGFRVGERVGIAWLGSTCGECRFCRAGRENLCERARFTGYQINGGYAELTVADSRYCFRLPEQVAAHSLAPWLCAGLIGYRSLRMAGDAQRLGLYGFGAAAHIVAQVARYEGRRVFAFTRPGDQEAQQFARGLGAEWAGDSTEKPPEELDAAILFAPVGALVPAALQVVSRGGTVVCAGIHSSDIPSFPYRYLWGERMLRSVANLTRQDGLDFLALAPRIPIQTETEIFPLSAANDALNRLRAGQIQGAAVLVPDSLTG